LLKAAAKFAAAFVLSADFYIYVTLSECGASASGRSTGVEGPL